MLTLRTWCTLLYTLNFVLHFKISLCLLIVIRWNKSQFPAHQNLLPCLVSPTSKYLNSLEDVQNIIQGIKQLSLHFDLSGQA